MFNRYIKVANILDTLGYYKIADDITNKMHRISANVMVDLPQNELGPLLDTEAQELMEFAKQLAPITNTYRKPRSEQEGLGSCKTIIKYCGPLSKDFVTALARPRDEWDTLVWRASTVVHNTQITEPGCTIILIVCAQSGIKDDMDLISIGRAIKAIQNTELLNEIAKNPVEAYQALKSIRSVTPSSLKALNTIWEVYGINPLVEPQQALDFALNNYINFDVSISESLSDTDKQQMIADNNTYNIYITDFMNEALSVEGKDWRHHLTPDYWSPDKVSLHSIVERNKLLGFAEDRWRELLNRDGTASATIDEIRENGISTVNAAKFYSKIIRNLSYDEREKAQCEFNEHRDLADNIDLYEVYNKVHWGYQLNNKVRDLLNAAEDTHKKYPDLELASDMGIKLITNGALRGIKTQTIQEFDNEFDSSNKFDKENKLQEVLAALGDNWRLWFEKFGYSDNLPENQKIEIALVASQTFVTITGTKTRKDNSFTTYLLEYYTPEISTKTFVELDRQWEFLSKYEPRILDIPPQELSDYLNKSRVARKFWQYKGDSNYEASDTLLSNIENRTFVDVCLKFDNLPRGIAEIDQLELPDVYRTMNSDDFWSLIGDLIKLRTVSSSNLLEYLQTAAQNIEKAYKITGTNESNKSFVRTIVLNPGLLFAKAGAIDRYNDYLKQHSLYIEQPLYQDDSNIERYKNQQKIIGVFGARWQEWLNKFKTTSNNPHETIIHHAAQILPDVTNQRVIQGLGNFLLTAYKGVETGQILKKVCAGWQKLPAETRKLPIEQLIDIFSIDQDYGKALSVDFAKEATKHGIPAEYYKDIEKMYLDSLQIPLPDWTQVATKESPIIMGNLKGYFLPRDDTRGMFLGDYTGCCQRIGGYANSAAIHGQTSPNAAFFVIENNKGDIVSQSWAWANTNKAGQRTVVLDNVEGYSELIDPQSEEIHNIIQQLAQILPVDNVHMGTGYSKIDYDRYQMVDKDNLAQHPDKSQYGFYYTDDEWEDDEGLMNDEDEDEYYTDDQNIGGWIDAPLYTSDSHRQVNLRQLVPQPENNVSAFSFVTLIRL